MTCLRYLPLASPRHSFAISFVSVSLYQTIVSLHSFISPLLIVLYLYLEWQVAISEQIITRELYVLDVRGG
jgi:hypothetical protein